MRNHRDAFFAYVDFVRDPDNGRELAKTSRFALLSRFLGSAPQELEQELQRAHAGRIPRRGHRARLRRARPARWPPACTTLRVVGRALGSRGAEEATWSSSGGTQRGSR